MPWLHPNTSLWIQYKKNIVLGSTNAHSSSSPELEVVPEIDPHQETNIILEPSPQHSLFKIKSC